MKRIHSVQVSGRELIVFLPQSYLTSDQHYPVAYVQDDGDLFSSCYNYLDHLVATGQLKEIILVGISSHERNHEYTPWPAESLAPGMPTFDGRGREYVYELADVIKPAIDSQYRTLPEAAHTAIMGGSFGGLISLFAGYWRPEVFGRLGLLSTSFWYEGVMSFLREQPAPSSAQRIYMSVGDCEGIYKTNIQKNMVASTKEVYALWLEKGFPEQQQRFSLTEGGTHDLLFMAQQFPQALQWLFGKVEKSSNGQHEEEAMVPYSRITSGFEIPNTYHHSMRAKRSGREYRISISVPPDPPPANGYPVLYVLDGNAVFGSMAEAMRLQGRKPHGIEPQVIVGIGYDADVPMVTDARFYDYTEEADASELPERRDHSAWPKTGGIEEFIAFIEEDLKPTVERFCSIDQKRQGLFGHSLGGYFALYVLFTRPEAFQTYIVGSPSIWWKGHSLLQKWPAVEQRLQKGELHAALLITIGEEERVDMVADAEELYTRMLPYQGDHFHVSFRKMEREGHISVLHPMISEIMRFIG
ncbi:alpha/beta hydrolase-fold protein [Brevibacillus sp. AY1]|uniref:alpha/beta hydrolase n=1 Tax=Brevibacillus sp. AY1 TaxID=2807621 RepID=UPI00245907BA|nr:alpha/beta hydrolase-fold protein [Brevibacillus sp. AY1]MDH4617820.1 alpha/beta hydrolase [Brevibacillus sp. AY1]